MDSSNIKVPKWKQPADIIQSTIGDFGRWQLRISIFMALLKFPIAWIQLGIVFLAPPTDYWCRQPEDYRAVMSIPQWREHIKPFENETNFYHGITNPKCVMRNVELDIDTSVQECKWGYDFDKSIVHSSIITEWKLVCDQSHYVGIAQMALMFGVLIGNIFFGILADRIGRKPTLIICIFLQAFAGVVAAWTPWWWVFVALRCLSAFANGGTMITSFVMCMETVGGRWRVIVPILYQIPFGIGNSLMAGAAYICRDWREFQLVLSGVSALFVVYIWFIPESPRWLLASGKKQEASKILHKAARFNRIDLKLTKATLAKLPSDNLQSQKPKVTEVFSTATLRKRSLLLCANWFISGVTFYAFSQHLGQMGTNLYVTVTLGGLIVIPGTFLCVFIVNKYGRRVTICGSNVFSAMCYLAILAVPRQMPCAEFAVIVFAGMGIIGLSVSTPALYLFTGELYPTVLRNVGVGVTVMFMRVGSMLAPWIVALDAVSYYLPLGILAALATLEALLVLPLPETQGGQLPDTIDDIEMKDISPADMVNGNYIAVPSQNPE